MHNAQEPSYYEIALTNRQVLGFFVVLLLCVVGAFFSGIWLGKKQSGDLTTMARAGTLVEQPAEEEEPLEELNFFTDDEQAEAPAPKARAAEPKRQEPAPSAGAGTTLAEDLGASQEARRAPSERTAAEIVSNAVRSEPAPSQTPSTPAPRPGGFVIQVFSSPDEAQARRLMDRLVVGGYEAFLLPETVGGRTMHRVRIGPFADRTEASALAPKVAKAFQVDTWITRNE